MLQMYQKVNSQSKERCGYKEKDDTQQIDITYFVLRKVKSNSVNKNKKSLLVNSQIQ